MDKGNTFGLMGIVLLVNMPLVKNLVKASMYGQMEIEKLSITWMVSN